MASLKGPIAYPMRPLNKEPDWSTAYDDLFNQYIDTDNLGFNNISDSAKDTSGSKDLKNTVPDSLDSSTASCELGGLSDHQWIAKGIEQDFWAKTLRSLEQSAAALTQDQGSVLSGQRNPKLASQSDFLSLGGFPSPHISAPCSPSEAARRRKVSLDNTRHPKPAPSPKFAGVKKTCGQSIRSPKMMSPSRYRAGFRDVWAEKSNGGKQPYTMNLPLRSVLLSPPPSAKMSQAVDSAAFCSPREIDTAAFPYVGYHEEQLSPKSSRFACRRREYTPNSSPLTSPGVERANFPVEDPDSFPRDVSDHRSMYYAIPPTAPHSTRTSWLMDENEADEDDYELSPTFNPWEIASAITQEEESKMSTLDLPPFEEVIAPYNTMPPSTIAASELATRGLLISCDPTLTTSSYPDAELSALPTSDYSYPAPCRSQHHQQASQQRLFSRTPSPTPYQTPRSRRASSKQRSRRTPSTPRSPRGTTSSAFVNFTPSDSAKLLTGVAPSGSSKTKARREKEAAEKRRKFSQAAVTALKEAGGDIGRLQDVMFQ